MSNAFTFSIDEMMRKATCQFISNNVKVIVMVSRKQKIFAGSQAEGILPPVGKIWNTIEIRSAGLTYPALQVANIGKIQPDWAVDI